MQNKRKTLVILGLFAVFMLGVSFAAVPLYRAFCQKTGFGGATKQSSYSAVALSNNSGKGLNKDSKKTGPNTITLNLNTNVQNGLNLYFRPTKNRVKIEIGKSQLVFFELINRSRESIKAIATYNVSPPQAGPFFYKIKCFCFDEQTFAPNEQVQLPVLLYIDKAIKSSFELKNLSEITLSYTFFASSSK